MLNISVPSSTAKDLLIPLAVGLCVGVGGLVIIIITTVCCLRHQSAARQHVNMIAANRQQDPETSRVDWLPLSGSDTISGTYGRYKNTGERYKLTDLESGYNTVASHGIESNDNGAYAEDEIGRRSL